MIARVATLLSLLLACTAEPAPAPAPAPPQPVAPAGPRLLPAPDGDDVAALVAGERAREGGPLIVYVGATWCEPCKAFHDALAAGELDAALPGARFLEFDLDRDQARLAAAGYASRYVPLFAVPGPDGRASGRQIEGGIKGPKAVAHILARLGPLVEEARGAR